LRARTLARCTAPVRGRRDGAPRRAAAHPTAARRDLARLPRCFGRRTRFEWPLGPLRTGALSLQTLSHRGTMKRRPPRVSRMVKRVVVYRFSTAYAFCQSIAAYSNYFSIEFPLSAIQRRCSAQKLRCTARCTADFTTGRPADCIAGCTWRNN